MASIIAGSAQVDISPKDSQFLFGYPHVERYSTSIADPLLSSALYLSDGKTGCIFVGNDIVFVSKASAANVRSRISQKTGLPQSNIMITATHTHSGPMTLDYLSNESDPVVPKTDAKYVRLMEDGIVEAALKAVANAASARLGMAFADGSVAGTNRRSPDGPSDPQVPVLLVQTKDGSANIAAMVVVSMHPTVLHEDSKAVSGDFPGLARIYLQQHVLGANCPVIYHTGPSGNQSPRHVTKANTYEEVVRIGTELGKQIERAIGEISFTDCASIKCSRTHIELPKRKFAEVGAAQAKLQKAVDTLEHLRKTNAPRQQIRTAECDWFGAEETLTLAKAQAQGKLEESYKICMPAEIQAFQIGPWSFVGWPGEIFVDYALDLKNQCSKTFVISLANGELQGYIVTKEAALEGGYEASNGLLEWQSGKILVEQSIQLIKGLC